MEAKPNIKVFNWLKLLGIYGVILLMLFIFYLAQDMLTPFLVAFLLVYLLNPVADRLEGLGLRRGIVVPTIFLGFILVVGLVLFLGRHAIINEVNDLQVQVPAYINKLRSSLEESAVTLEQKVPFLPKGYLKKAVNDKAAAVPQMVADKIPSLLLSAIGLLTSTIIVLFVTFFLLKDGREFRKRMIKVVPNKYFETVLCLLYEINLSIGNYIRGQIIDCTIVGILSIIGLSLIGLKYAIIIGVMSGAFNLIPYLGPVLSMVPAVLISIIEHQDLIMAVKAIAVLMSVQLIDNAIISPLAVGKSVDIHPIAVIISVTVGGALMGVWGMLLAVPAFCALKVTFEILYKGIIEYGSWETN
jgi:predicted PurR-regulated permease PerM